ncbi:MAG: 50S ribosomal protein L11 methyltransferase [Proteobacteria bacterium]|nr:50S ribosomal protein L11 methyltransferase [Pseudomonadota bacterium]
MNSLAKLSFRVPEAAAPAVAQLLMDRVGPGLEQRDDGTLSPPPPGTIELMVWVPEADVASHVEHVERLVASLAQLDVAANDVSWQTDAVATEDWWEAYKQSFRAMRVGRHFLIRPSWDAEAAVAAGDRLIELDPGMAFGTGGHASTRLALSAIERLDQRGHLPHAALDVGCGAGILALAAVKVWPELQAQAIDDDPIAVRVCRENIARNQLEARVTVTQQDGAAITGSYDLVLANLSFDVLTALKPTLTQALSATGRLVLSGLLAEQAATIARQYGAELALEVEYSEEDSGWRGLLLRRRA